ncbi:3-phenylpropionate/cinnamic acid dioxygenase subunit beta [Caulobacter sp. SSI4214]|uniref:3-phenylpropionate/cinnamic acid dioxygenase subunit beta n=1 Tax=Caulobacter sp. SSI4214 TaxID=2575739 RepID=UPI001438F30A|nr:3-phenylpropionate/cinnamic acid dioxygenase subunit beta [Caulobacter sp. SSI4214]
MNALADRKPDYAALPTLDRAAARAAAESLLAMRGDGLPVDDALLLQIERFYRREARLLDEECYDAWYETLADDLFYWMPLRENRFRRDKRQPLDPDAMAMFDERKADIAVRLGRLASNLVWTEDPPTRHAYVVSNVEAFETPVPGEFEVHSVFVQYRNRSEHDDATLTGRRRDLLRLKDGRFQIARRLILMPQSVLLTKNLSAFF